MVYEALILWHCPLFYWFRFFAGGSYRRPTARWDGNSLINPNRITLGVPSAITSWHTFVAKKNNTCMGQTSPISAIYGNIAPYQETPASLFLNPLGILLLVVLIVVVFGQRKRVLR